MLCFYINLDTATLRKNQIENRFSHFKFNETLHRFNAINVNDVLNLNISGKITNIEKACFLSHATLIKSQQKINDHLFIMEDDIDFFRGTFSIIDNTIKAIEHIEWDILYTDVCVPEPSTMIDLVKIKNELQESKSFRILDLKNMYFAGATGYIINKKSISKLSKLIEDVKELDTPFDLLLRNFIFNNEIKGYAIFPFITTLSNEAFKSQIQPQETLDTDLVWNVFRKLIWADSKVEDQELLVGKIRDEFCDPDSLAYATVIASCISKKFLKK